MKELCITCRHCGYDKIGGYFYTTTCESCRERTRVTHYIAKIGAVALYKINESL